ncbi:hypothetical protein SEA_BENTHERDUNTHAT_59 [Gordonia phage BENtherdunthat]|uniref:Helix-turn-helix DNA binding domain protein n=1 Tax=Gordonia phage BENtherdunthat TaxID=2047830 RepID=A0A2H4PFD0_9CAUD|nr:transposase [Gordonia phage BENtherdunthat]ATW60829.1 hypothetical protein SEA_BENTHERDUNTHAT_59 [Gordonia phage BENtherdunthat]
MTLTHELAADHWPRDPQTGPVEGTQLPRTHVVLDIQISDGAGTQTSSRTQSTSDTHSGNGAAGPNLTDSQSRCDNQKESAIGDPTSASAILPTGTQAPFADADPSSPVAIPHTTSTAVAPQGSPTATGGQTGHGAHTTSAPGGWLRDPVIGVLADVLDDLETVRIANANRVRILTRNEEDSDGENRGFGLTEDHPEVAKLALTVKALGAAEHDAILNLQRALRKHPLAAFQKRHKGLGEKQFARLLAAIGDPYWNDLHDRPRTVSELWAYAGFHVIRTSGSGHGSNDTHHPGAAAGSNVHPDGHTCRETHVQTVVGVAPKRQRGQQSNWSETARKRTWVIASAMPKFPGGHYESVYRAAREKYAESVHPTDCVRCGPAGKPALAGSPLSDGHKHARAIRIVAKELLKDIWRESRDLYEEVQNDG